MSQENVEVMRRAMEAFNRRDGDEFGALLTSDAVIVPVRAALEGTVYSGPSAAERYCAAVDESWEDLTWEIEEFREGSDWVLALGHIQGRGRSSGAALDARAGWVARFREGSIWSFQTYPDRGDALEAVGLAEQGMSQESMEVLRRGIDAYNRRDLDGILANWAADAVVDWSNSRGPEAGVYRGHEEIRAHWQRFLSAFAEARIELVDAVEVSDGVLVAENVTYFRGRDDIEVQARSAWVTTIRDGRTTSLTLYQTKEEALEAARGPK